MDHAPTFGRAYPDLGEQAAAFVHATGKRATDDVVFGEPGDLVLLGARSLEGLNLRIEPTRRQLVDAEPVPAAGATRHPDYLSAAGTQ